MKNSTPLFTLVFCIFISLTSNAQNSVAFNLTANVSTNFTSLGYDNNGEKDTKKIKSKDNKEVKNKEEESKDKKKNKEKENKDQSESSKEGNKEDKKSTEDSETSETIIDDASIDDNTETTETKIEETTEIEETSETETAEANTTETKTEVVETSEVEEEEKVELTFSTNKNKLFFLVKESFPKEGKGQTYFDENWSEGIVTDYDGERFQMEVRYSLITDEMEVKHLSQTKALHPEKISQVEFNDKTFVAARFMEGAESFITYFELIADGNIQILNRYQSTEKKGKYSMKDTLYIKKADQPAKKLNFKKAAILEMMKDHKSKVNEFVSKNKINFKKLEDIKKLISFYNTL